MDEGALIRKAQAGDDAALETIVRTYAPQAYRLAARLAGDAVSPDDIVQEAFVKTWRNLDRFDPAKPFAPWFLAIVRNAALDALRKRRLIPFSRLSSNADENGLAFTDTLADEAPLPDELFARAESAQRITSAVAALPERDRTVLVLRYENELPFEDIGTVMGAPMNTVKSWHRRAQARLRALLEQSAPRHD